MRVLTHESPAEVAAAAARFVATSLDGRGPATLALAGGSTPRATHQIMQGAPIEWSQVTMWLADERWVPADHPDSNERMARETLVDAVGGTLVAPRHGADAHAAAAEYAATLDTVWAERDGVHVPDIVMLGIGDDGHTASLFPDTAALDEVTASYVANWVEAKEAWRLTATIPLLSAARQIVFLVTGAAKADVLRRILIDDEPFPAQRVSAEAEGDVVWMLDAAAASQLNRPR